MDTRLHWNATPCRADRKVILSMNSLLQQKPSEQPGLTVDCTRSNEDWLNEFAASAISKDLALANVRWVDGPDAVEEFLSGTIAQRQRNQTYITAGNRRLLDRYQFLEAGGWIAYGVTLEDTQAGIPYLKPSAPEWDRSKGKSIKYPNPPGMEARPVLPDITPRIPEGWSGLVGGGGIVLLAEGLKKALSGVEHGIPSIALRGITQWHPKGSKDLWPEIAQAVRGKIVPIAFDQDERQSTRSNVHRQARMLGYAIEKAGGTPRFMVWPAAMGKGLDDALASLPPEQRRAWLDSAIATALTQKQFKRVETIEAARAILATEGPQAERETTGEYLPELPPLTRGGLHWLSATMNSGKTCRMGRDWVRPWGEAGGIAVVLSPLNSLGQQTGQDWGLPHIHDYGTDANSQRALQADISQSGGLVACLNSAHRVRALIPQDAPLLLIFDEAAQVLNDAAEGGTLKGEWAARWEDTIALMQRAATDGAIALAEDGLDQATIDLVQFLSGAQLVRGFSHTKELEPWETTIYRGTPLSAYRADLIRRLQAGDRIFVPTTSQKEARRLQKAAQQLGIDSERIDSSTNEAGRYRKFFEAPEPWLYERQPQLLILTTSGKTGLSIEGGISVEGAYFDAVWGYFPSLDTDTHKQLLGRYRPAVPRHIWAPAYIAPEPGEGPKQWGITRELDAVAAQYAGYGGFDQAPADSQDAAIKKYLAARRQRRWAQKIMAADALADALQASGHQVQLITSDIEGDEKITKLWNQIKEDIAREDSAYHAGLEIDPDIHTWEWANQIIRGIESTYEQRCKAAKVRMMQRFPGLDWHDAQLWYDAEFCPRKDVTKERPSQGPLAPGAALWAEAGHYSELWAEDTKEAAQVLGQRLKAAHLLPKSGVKAMLANLFRPDVERMLQAGEVSPTGQVEQSIKANALRYRAELRRYWRLTIDESQSAVAIANKIARKFGLILERSRKLRVDGAQCWLYSISASETWYSLVLAREFALNNSGTSSLNCTFNGSVPLPPPDPPHGDEGEAKSPSENHHHPPNTQKRRTA